MGTEKESEEASNLPQVSVTGEAQEGHAPHPITSLQGADIGALVLPRSHEGEGLVTLGTDDQQVVSPCPNPVTSFEIHVDGSDLASIDPTSHGLEVLVTVERNNEDQSGQLDLANDIAISVCLDGIGEAVVREGGSFESGPEIAEIQVDAVEAGTETSGHGVDPHESLDYVDNAEVRLATDDGSNGERKRQREDLEEHMDRAPKFKSMSHTVSNSTRERMDTDGCSLTQLTMPEDALTATVLAADVQGNDCCGDTVVANGMDVPAEHNEMTEVKPEAMPNAGIQALNVQASERMDHDEHVTDVNNISGGTDYLNKPNAPVQGLHLEACQQADQRDHGKDGTDIRISAEEAACTDTNEGPSSKDLKDSESQQTARARPRKKRKIAMLVAYCGAGYQGMQKNPGAITIEGLLEEALIKAGAMPENYDGNPRKVDWMRAARTDKGVSAVGQVVSGQFYVDPPGFVERVNDHLPKQIRLIGYKRVTPTFSAKKFCDRRRYEYVIPLFALDAAAHRDRETVLASEGTDSAFVKCQECSERGRKVPGAVCKGSRSFTSGEKQVVVQGNGNVRKEITDCIKSDADTVKDQDSVVSTNLSDDSFDKEAGSAPTESFTINTDSEMMLSGNSPAAFDASKEKGEMIDAFDASMAKAEAIDRYDARMTKDEVTGASETTAQFVSPVQVKEQTSSFQFGEAERTKLNRILNYYVGTHNFHNFTSRIKAEDPSAKRYIVSFETGDVFTVRNTAFVKCTVVGQSFMLHQIRKMIGLAIAIFRGCAPESMLHRALRSDVNVTIPTAPELGLFLDECMYPAYNQKWYDTHEEVSQKGYEAVLNQFKHEVIYEHIAATEDKEGQMALFLHSLNDRNYSDFASAREADAVSG